MGALPNPGVALAAVPDLGARLLGDESVAAGCLRDWLWSRPSPRVPFLEAAVRQVPGRGGALWSAGT